MSEKLKLNEDTVKKLPAPAKGNKVYFFAGDMLQGALAPRGFGVRVTQSGVKSFVIDYRVKSGKNKGKQRRYTIGEWNKKYESEDGSRGVWSVLAAVKASQELRRRIDLGEDPIEDRAPPSKTKTVSEVIDDFVARYVRNKERPLRTADEYENALNRLVKPRIGNRGIYDLERSHVAEMLDKIEDENGPVMADRTRAYFRKALGWWAERDPKFNLNAAIVRVTPRANAKDRARTRVLSDDEIRIIWPLLGSAGTFGVLVKTLLLTAQRLNEIASMSRKEINTDGVFTIPASRYKSKRESCVPLSKAALAIIEEQKKISKCEYVFASSAKTPFSAFGKSKAALDKAILTEMKKEDEKAEPMPHWTLHDLRRTAKTLMMRGGVRPDVSERVLGHVIAGVEGVYDRYDYESEKRDALEKLAAMIERILNPLPSNVAALDEHRARA